MTHPTDAWKTDGKQEIADIILYLQHGKINEAMAIRDLVYAFEHALASQRTALIEEIEALIPKPIKRRMYHGSSYQKMPDGGTSGAEIYDVGRQSVIDEMRAALAERKEKE